MRATFLHSSSATSSNAFVVCTCVHLRRTAGSPGADYRMTQGVVPVRWTAPEGLTEHKFSTASDVWSFGITVVEVIQDGLVPYTYVNIRSNPALITMVTGGQVHPRPDGCSNVVYATLMKCWAFEPLDRPSFDELLDFFSKATPDMLTQDRLGGIFLHDGNFNAYTALDGDGGDGGQQHTDGQQHFGFEEGGGSSDAEYATRIPPHHAGAGSPQQRHSFGNAMYVQGQQGNYVNPQAFGFGFADVVTNAMAPWPDPDVDADPYGSIAAKLHPTDGQCLHRTPYGSPLHCQKCGARFILHCVCLRCPSRYGLHT